MADTAKVQSNLILVVGIYLLTLGIGASLTAYEFSGIEEPLRQTDMIMRLALTFIPAAILGTLGIGLMLHKRWALFGYLGLTAFFLVALSGALLSSGGGSVLMTINVFISAFMSFGIPALLVFNSRALFESPHP